MIYAVIDTNVLDPMSPDPLKLNIAKYGDKYHKNFPNIETYNYFCCRVFFILDEGNIIILFNGFQKKTQKTPKQEIEKAIKLKKQYYAEKQ